jgi:imidazolonepropionase-like amidohydrolase
MRVGAGIATAYGLDRQAALDAMTRNPARIWGVEAGYGAIEAGKSADLVIWSGDPLEALTQPVAVYIAGEAVTNASRHQLLRETYLPETAR